MGWYLDGKPLGSGISEDEKGAPSGVATLDGSGKHDESETNELARNRVYLVADAAARMALTPKEGHEAIQADDASQWIYDDIVGWIQRTGGGGGLPILSGAGNPNGVTIGALHQRYRDTVTNTYYTQITDPTGWDWNWE